ncbi:MAG: asparagine synthase (glutamine-hydrolyzing) [Anaerolineales bacterium]|nr:asparagine synthase (glutamine-hydrolyzing) [Anaerolineales bacterium]
MCGICGVVSSKPNFYLDEAILRRMTHVLNHRGPDDEGYYLGMNVGLGMRRLSIIDLVTGQQPMTNEDQTIWLVYNGEIYNYQQLRRRLIDKGHIFTSESDSEVVIHAYEEYGDSCVEYFNGMFAFAVWDSRCHRLLLVRDRLGIKPLYYWNSGGQLVFGSELKAVIANPDVPREIDLIALDQFLTFEYIPAPRTIFKGVHKLMPGYQLVFQDGRITLEQYWDVHFERVSVNERDCAEFLHELIYDAVQMRLVSDVPLGAFLSGGIDSSTVVACMSEAVSYPVRTFSIGFEDASYNELPYARKVATHFRTDHTEEILKPDIATLAEHLANQLDEPFADFSIFPTYLVSRLARQSVKVVLSGDGGDELFGGYDTYVAQHLDRYYRWLPTWLRQWTMPAIVAQIPPQSSKKGLVNKVKRFVEGGALPQSLQHARWMIFMNEGDKASLYRPDLRAALDGSTPVDILERHFQQTRLLAPLCQQQYVDIKTYLPDDILTKVDRMTMAVSLEARAPLLDHRIVEFALNLPPSMKLRGLKTKMILRQAMSDYLPKAVLDKPKQGFSIPLKHWLRGPLKSLMTDLLSVDSIRRRGYFEPRCVINWISEHLDGRVNNSHRLWALIVFELWHQQVLGERTPLRVNTSLS